MKKIKNKRFHEKRFLENKEKKERARKIKDSFLKTYKALKNIDVKILEAFSKELSKMIIEAQNTFKLFDVKNVKLCPFFSSKNGFIKNYNYYSNKALENIKENELVSSSIDGVIKAKSYIAGELISIDKNGAFIKYNPTIEDIMKSDLYIKGKIDKQGYPISINKLGGKII